MTDPIIHAAARALYGNGVMSPDARKYHEELAARLVPAIAPLIRAAALEEAAMVADDEDGQFSYAGQHNHMAMLQQHGYEIAASIRALKASAEDST